MKSKKRPQAVQHKPTHHHRSASKQCSGAPTHPAQCGGIDCGAEYHYVAVPDRDSQPVRAFRTFTTDLYRLADWLVQCGVKTVAMESTGYTGFQSMGFLRRAAWRWC